VICGFRVVAEVCQCELQAWGCTARFSSASLFVGECAQVLDSARQITSIRYIKCTESLVDTLSTSNIFCEKNSDDSQFLSACNRQHKREARTHFVAHLCSAAVQLCHPPNDCQAKPGVTMPFALRRPLIEPFEHAS
jgi:hypothetical protein